MAENVVDSLVTTAWLADHLNDVDLRVLDVRGFVRHLDQPDGTMIVTYEAAHADYERGHIPGAPYVDWTRDVVDLADPVPVQVASIDTLATLFGHLGITRASHVVLYDAAGSTLATRLWWVFRYAGHERVSILDGGFARWTAEGHPITTAVPTFTPATYEPSPRLSLRVTAEETLAASQAGAALLIDARAPDQWRGDVVRSGRAGHIPGAVNVPSTRLFRPEGGLKSPEELKEILASVGASEETPIIAYCGGGVSATAVLFALDRLGHRNWSNYDGSWNEWGPRTDLPTESAPDAKPPR